MRTTWLALALCLLPAVTRAQEKGFDSIEVETSGGFHAIHRTLRVQSDGTATLDGFTGKATAAELRSLASELATVDPATLPDEIPMQGDRLSSDSQSKQLAIAIGGKTYRTSIASTVDMDRKWDARLSRLFSLLYGIESRLDEEQRQQGQRPPQIHAARSFDSLELSTSGGDLPVNRMVSITKEGSVTATVGLLGKKITGRATARELSDVMSALAPADPATLPAVTVDEAKHGPADKLSLTLKSVIGGKSYKMEAPGSDLGKYAKRVQPLIDVLWAIAGRLSRPQAAPKTFDKLSTKLEGGNSPIDRWFVLNGDGSATAHYKGQDYTGEATSEEWKAVVDAYANADLKTLPSTIEVDMIADVPSETLEAVIAGATTTIFMPIAGRLGTYSKRLLPLLEALRAIEERLWLGPIMTIQGVVHPDGAASIAGWIVKSDPKQLLAPVKGRLVTAVIKLLGQPGDTKDCELLSLVAKNETGGDVKVTATPTGGEVVGTAPRGAIQVTAVSRNFLEVTVNGKKGYVRREGFVIGADPPSETPGMVHAVERKAVTKSGK